MQIHEGHIRYLMRLSIAKFKLQEASALLSHVIGELGNSVPENSYAEMQCHIKDWRTVIDAKEQELYHSITERLAGEQVAEPDQNSGREI